MHKSTLTMRLLTSAILTVASFNVFSQQEDSQPQERGDTRQFEEFSDPEQDNNGQRQKAPTLNDSGPMTLEKLTAIINEVGNNVEVQNGGSITFTFNEAQLIAVVAEQANRMRLIAPIVAAGDLTADQMAATLVSNYHLALDARYAVGEGVLYSAYIHPLKELTSNQLVSAIRQVATLRNTFGTSYTSGEMSFGVQTEERIDI